MEFSILGSLRVTGADGPVAITGHKERALLVALAMSAGDVVSTERLIDALWGDAPPRSNAKLLQNLVLRLRKTIGSASIETAGVGYTLLAAPELVDLRRFDNLTRRGRQHAAAGDDQPATSAFAAAAELWRGSPLIELADWPPAYGERSRLEEQYRAVLEDWAEAAVACGQHHEWIAPLEQMVFDEPLREQRWASLMRALSRCGRQADALRAFQRARMALRDVGLEPGTELRALENDISTHPLDATASLPSSPSRKQPVGSAAATPSNLPPPLNRFVGRTRELHEIDEHLRMARLVTLTGVGGAGKTRLALEAARVAATADRYPDGVWFVELATVRAGTAVQSAIASILGLEVRGDDLPEAVTQLVCDRLAPERTLLVLDNCEHLIDDAADTIQTLVVRCMKITVLATSQELIGIPGEKSVPVPPLSMPPEGWSDSAGVASWDSVSLFCERASMARAQFELNDDNVAAVVDICRRVDGIPLAIELAAARVRMLAVGDIAQRLSDYFHLLSGGPRTATPRHRTLWAALDWSYDLLTAPEKRALRRLAVFPDTFDLAACVAVVSDGEDVASAHSEGFDLVSRLIERSFVVVLVEREVVRYRLLQPVRHYASQALEASGDAADARRRHREFFQARAASLSATLGAMTHSARVAVDQPSFEAALDGAWCDRDVDATLRLTIVLGALWYWEADSRGLRWLERALAEPGAGDSSGRALALTQLSFMLPPSADGSLDREQHLMAEALAVARRLDDRETNAGVRFALGEFNIQLGNLDVARDLIEETLASYEEFGSPASVGWCHHHLGWIAIAQDRARDALTHFEKAVERSEEDASDVLAAHALGALAVASARLGDSAHALRVADQAVVEARQNGVRGVLTMALVRAAQSTAILSALVRCGEILEELLQLLRASRARRWTGDALETAALVLAARGETSAAARALGASGSPYSRSGDTAATGILDAELAALRDQLLLKLGEQQFRREHGHGQELGAQPVIAELLAVLRRPAVIASAVHHVR